MFAVYLKEFITTGKFGPIELGMPIEKVINLLGEPEGQTDYNNGHCEIIYAWYEFFYLKDSQILYGIQNDHLATFPNIKTGRVNNKRDICFHNDYFEIDIWFLKKNRFLTFIDVVDNLEKEGIDFEIDEGFEKTKNIKFPSGVTLDFDDLGGLSSYDKESNSWSWAEKIEGNNKKILNGVRLYNLDLT